MVPWTGLKSVYAGCAGKVPFIGTWVVSAIVDAVKAFFIVMNRNNRRRFMDRRKIGMGRIGFSRDIDRNEV